MPRGPRQLQIRYGAGGLTPYGGAYLLHRFLSRLGFRDLVARYLRMPQRNARYTVGEQVVAVLYPLLLGLDRIETAQLLERDGVFQFLAGLPGYPDATTRRRFLRRVAPAGLADLRALHDLLLVRQLARGPHLRRVILDLDSTVLVVYGQREQARVGYNPQKRGRPSYHPLLCFEGQTGDFWHGELRPGNAASGTGALELLKACEAKCPRTVRRVIVRADKGFYDHQLTEWLEAQGAGYAIVARLTPPIKRRLGHLRYRRFGWGAETAEFRYQPMGWASPARFVVVRRPDPEEPSEQLRLFKMGRYRYQALVTNLPLQPLAVWRFYNDRAGVELIIRQLKGEYALGHIPSRHFVVNEAYFHLLLLGYNLINWFKRLCLPLAMQTATLQTLRHQVLRLPAQLTRPQNRPRLALAARGDREAAWRFALARIRRLRP